ncbi:MAG: PIN domain-containing protein [archaeon]|nr:PIN domain-containing protein [archaeon]
MSKRIYLDTNIYVDYCEGRADSIRPLQEFAFRLLQKTFECKYDIVVSDWLFRELEKSIKHKEPMNLLLSELKAKNKMFYTKSTRSELASAQSHENWTDALHAIIAKRMGCKFIVTRNTMDFLEFSHILEPKLPEEL